MTWCLWEPSLLDCTHIWHQSSVIVRRHNIRTICRSSSSIRKPLIRWDLTYMTLCKMASSKKTAWNQNDVNDLKRLLNQQLPTSLCCMCCFITILFGGIICPTIHEQLQLASCFSLACDHRWTYNRGFCIECLAFHEFELIKPEFSRQGHCQTFFNLFHLYEK